MRWKVTIEGMDEFGGRGIAEVVIEREFSQLANGEIGLRLSDGKTIMACLQQFVVKQQCEAYVLTRRYCADCRTFRRIKDYGRRKIRTVWARRSRQSADHELSALSSPFLRRFGRLEGHLPRSGRRRS
jgi:hypothetical protein